MDDNHWWAVVLVLGYMAFVLACLWIEQWSLRKHLEILWRLEERRARTGKDEI